MKTSADRIIHVLVVEDSPTVREFLIHILHRDPQIRVVGTASDGQEAVELVQRLRPDVITMDINMPRMNGFEATRRIMETQPTPIVIVSGHWDPGEVETTFRALEAGAQAVLPRPGGSGEAAFEVSVKELVQMVKLMSEVKVIRRWPRARSAVAPAIIPPGPVQRAPGDIRVVAIGASTGGPPVLQTILSRLPREFPVPVLLVQHMAPGFVQGFSDWLAQSTPLCMQVARHGEALLPGHVYVAPDGCHMGVASNGCVVLSQEQHENGARPAVSTLFRAVARVFGKHAVGVLLTGMGKDGAEELKTLRDLGAVTIAQDKESSVVHGMPGEAIKCAAATYVLPPEGIADMLRRVVHYSRRRQTGEAL
jgi:two-component system, chemotaxis family, protein-glutamate methylesterase/glutaminase